MSKSNPEKVLMSAAHSAPSGGDGQPAAPIGNGKLKGTARAKKGPEREAGWRPKENILEIAASMGRFQTLGRAIEAAGLTDKLSGRGPFTLFAPTDQAFAKMPSADLDALLANKAELSKLLSQHVVPTTVRAPRRNAPSQITMLDGREREISVVAEDGGYRIGDARIVKTNIRAANGVIHAIDTVLTTS